jgi:tetrahydromethanopterin S-methyltransferase subunit G
MKITSYIKILTVSLLLASSAFAQTASCHREQQVVIRSEHQLKRGQKLVRSLTTRFERFDDRLNDMQERVDFVVGKIETKQDRAELDAERFEDECERETGPQVCRKFDRLTRRIVKLQQKADFLRARMNDRMEKHGAKTQRIADNLQEAIDNIPVLEEILAEADAEHARCVEARDGGGDDEEGDDVPPGDGDEDGDDDAGDGEGDENAGDGA